MCVNDSKYECVQACMHAHLHYHEHLHSMCSFCFWNTLIIRSGSILRSYPICTCERVASIPPCHVHRARKKHIRTPRNRGVVLWHRWGEEDCRYILFCFYFLCVSYCSEALASFLGRGKKSCVRCEGVCHFAYINALVHKHSSEVCAYRNLCTIANRADQFVGSLIQEYKIWHMVI